MKIRDLIEHLIFHLAAGFTGALAKRPKKASIETSEPVHAAAETIGHAIANALASQLNEPIESAPESTEIFRIKP
jgi:hypothetical protein